MQLVSFMLSWFSGLIVEGPLAATGGAQGTTFVADFALAVLLVAITASLFLFFTLVIFDFLTAGSDLPVCRFELGRTPPGRLAMPFLRSTSPSIHFVAVLPFLAILAWPPKSANHARLRQSRTYDARRLERLHCSAAFSSSWWEVFSLPGFRA
jgi:hypothetical protein